MKFMRGDLVKVCKDMPSHMSHFESNFRAIVLYTYASAYGGDNHEDVGLLNLKNGREIAWYNSYQLTFIKRIKEETILKTINKMKPIWDRRKIRLKEKNEKASINLLTRKKKLPEGTIGRMYQDAFEKTFLEILNKLPNCVVKGNNENTKT